MMKFLLPIFLILQTCGPAFASNAGYIDANGIKNMAHTRSWAMPNATGTLSCIACTESPTNKTIAIGSNTFTGQFTPANGGTGIDTSASTGVLQFSSGSASVGAVSLAGSNVSGNLGVSHLNSGTNAGATTFWRGDGTWVTPGGGGTVTSITFSSPLTGGTITGSGSVGLGTVSPSNGGTGQTSLNSTVFTTLWETIATTGGDLIYGGASGAPTRLANGSSGQVLTAAGGTSAETWTSLPGNYLYSAYWPTSGGNNWQNTNSTFGDFTVNGTIPAPTVFTNNNFGTVTNATSSLPGVHINSAPRTGTIKITFVASVNGSENATATQWGLLLLESTTSTQLAITSGSSSAGSAIYRTPMTLVGYFAATAGTAYNFKLQSAVNNSDTVSIGGVGSSGGIGSQLQVTLEYVN